jgi:hypothetical protein
MCQAFGVHAHEKYQPIRTDLGFRLLRHRFAKPRLDCSLPKGSSWRKKIEVARLPAFRERGLVFGQQRLDQASLCIVELSRIEQVAIVFDVLKYDERISVDAALRASIRSARARARFAIRPACRGLPA